MRNGQEAKREERRGYKVEDTPYIGMYLSGLEVVHDNDGCGQAQNVCRKRGGEVGAAARTQPAGVRHRGRGGKGSVREEGREEEDMGRS